MSHSHTKNKKGKHAHLHLHIQLCIYMYIYIYVFCTRESMEPASNPPKSAPRLRKIEGELRELRLEL